MKNIDTGFNHISLRMKRNKLEEINTTFPQELQCCACNDTKGKRVPVEPTTTVIEHSMHFTEAQSAKKLIPEFLFAFAGFDAPPPVDQKPTDQIPDSEGRKEKPEGPERGENGSGIGIMGNPGLVRKDDNSDDYPYDAQDEGDDPDAKRHGGPIRFGCRELLEILGECHSLFEGLVLQLHVLPEKLLFPYVVEDEPDPHDHSRYQDNFHVNLLVEFCRSSNESLLRHFCFIGSKIRRSKKMLQHLASI